MTNKDLFHNAVEGRMEELKQKPIVEEKETRGEKINKIFFFTHHFKCVTYYYCNTAAQANSDFFE